MQLFIKVNDINIVLNFDEEITIIDVFNEINNRMRINENYYYLTYNSRILNKNDNNYKIKNLSTFQLIYRAC